MIDSLSDCLASQLIYCLGITYKNNSKSEKPRERVLTVNAAGVESATCGFVRSWKSVCCKPLRDEFFSLRYYIYSTKTFIDDALMNWPCLIYVLCLCHSMPLAATWHLVIMKGSGHLHDATSELSNQSHRMARRMLLRHVLSRSNHSVATTCILLHFNNAAYCLCVCYCYHHQNRSGSGQQ